MCCTVITQSMSSLLNPVLVLCIVCVQRQQYGCLKESSFSWCVWKYYKNIWLKYKWLNSNNNNNICYRYSCVCSLLLLQVACGLCLHVLNSSNSTCFSLLWICCTTIHNKLKQVEFELMTCTLPMKVMCAGIISVIRCQVKSILWDTSARIPWASMPTRIKSKMHLYLPFGI